MTGPFAHALAFFSLLASTAAHEPVGPISDRKIDETKITYVVSTDGDDSRDGRSRETAFATLQKAADVLEPGLTTLDGIGYQFGVALLLDNSPVSIPVGHGRLEELSFLYAAPAVPDDEFKSPVSSSPMRTARKNRCL